MEGRSLVHCLFHPAKRKYLDQLSSDISRTLVSDLEYNAVFAEQTRREKYAKLPMSMEK